MTRMYADIRAFASVAIRVVCGYFLRIAECGSPKVNEVSRKTHKLSEADAKRKEPSKCRMRSAGAARRQNLSPRDPTEFSNSLYAAPVGALVFGGPLSTNRPPRRG